MPEPTSTSQFSLPNPLNLGLIKLLNQPLEQRLFYPRAYLGASDEVFGLTLITTWLFTLAFYPEQIFEHPARPIIGSLNPCFGWDYPPVSLFAHAACSVNVYLTWRYAWLERARTFAPSESRIHFLKDVLCCAVDSDFLCLGIVFVASVPTGLSDATVSASRYIPLPTSAA